MKRQDKLPSHGAATLIATDIPFGHPRLAYFERMDERLNAQAGGAWPHRLVLDGALYAGRQGLDAVRTGAVQAAWINASHLEALRPDLCVLNMPFGPGDEVLGDFAKARALVDWIDGHTRTQGVRVLGLMRGADQLFISPTRSIETPDDLKGLRIRVAGPGMYEALMRSLGAEPVVMPVPHIRDSFRSGALDCVFTSPGGWRAQFGLDVRLGTRVPGLMFVNYVLVAGAAWLDSLAPAHAAALCQAADDCVTRAWPGMQEDDDDVLQLMADQGCTVRTVADRAVWQRHVAPLGDATRQRYPAAAAELRAVCEGGRG